MVVFESIWPSVIVILLVAACVWLLPVHAQNKALAETPKAEAVIQAPKESRLAWENHRLKAANFRLQADAEDKAADTELEVMQRAVGDKYAPRISQQTGQLEFYLKEAQVVDAKAKPTEKPKQ